jgi:shikimate dehydrogenase
VTDQSRRLAVLGSPIVHSLSPRLHRAAYSVLGLPWVYEAIDMDGDRLAGFLDACDDSWRGLSLTMPLKRDVIPLLDSMDRVAAITGVVNTLLFENGSRRGYNTDVAGITGAFRRQRVEHLGHVVILGGGATAASALVAASELGATSARVWVRTPAKVASMLELGVELGVAVTLHSFTEQEGGLSKPDAVISTLPNGSVVNLVIPEEIRRNSVLFDVAYDPWPTALAQAWSDVSAPVISGIEMLLGQALVQVRIFVGGDPERELPQESRVIEAMRASVESALPA